MKFNLKKLTALILTVLLVLSLFPTAAFATNPLKRERAAIAKEETHYGYTPVPQVGNRALTEAYLRGEADETNETRAPLPSRYDGRDYNYLTAVKHQGNYETCWTFATMAPIEAYMIKHGVTDPTTGRPATTSLNLSEYHLCWFNYTDAYDKKGMLTGDYTTPRLSNFLMNTGLFMMSAYTLMRWEGVASESTEALKYSNASTRGLDKKYAYDYNVAHLTNATWIPMSNRDAVKRAIMEYGAGGFGFYCYIESDSVLYNPNTAAYCFNQDSVGGSYNANHAVTLVGWDDNYSKNNFKSDYGPRNNGAWIVRNSYGSSWGDGGYFYLSYEDTASYNDSVYFFAVDSTDNFTNCYQYDGTSNLSSYKAMGNNAQVANIFTASGAETLNAVAISTWDEAVTYTVRIYKNLTSATNPSSGTLVSTQNGSFSYPGYYTVDLTTPVSLDTGDTFSVVFTLSTPSADPYDNKYLHVPYDATDSSISWVRFTHANRGNTSYYKEANGNWYDCPGNGDFRIKAYTDPRTTSHTHSYGAWTSNNNGTHSRTCSCGDKQTVNCTYTDVVTPPTTYSQGYTTHTCTACAYSYRDSYTDPIGSTTRYTVNFYVPNGVNAVPSQTVNANSYITLPTANAPSGYTFVGWVANTVSNTTTRPTVLTGSYKVSGNVSLYALYSYVSAGNGSSNDYALLNSAPADWTGNYVITYGTNTSSLYVLKGLSGDTKYESATSGGAVLLSNTGMSYADGKLTGATAPYIFKVEASGSKYSIKNTSTNTYVGSYNTYLYSRASYNANDCLWTLSCSNQNVTAANSASSSYPYMSFSTGSKYFMLNRSASTGLYFWKQSSGGSSSTTYYTTNPTVNTHTHSYGAWTSNYNGTHGHTCSCGDKQTVGCTYTDVVTAPTTTAQGYTTHTCTTCGYSYRDSYTNPIANTTYTVSFSVPNGVSAIASQTVTANSSINLPTAGAPAGYTFLGWVTSAVNNATARPSNVLTGSYSVTGNITLRALYSYTASNGGGSGDYMLLGSAPADWTGNYVITFGTNTNSLYVLKGLSGDTSYESSYNGGAVALSSTGMTFSGTSAANAKLTGVSNAYVFNIAADGAYYTIKNASTNTYLGNYSSYLYSRSAYNSSYCRWTLTCNNGNMTVKNAASSSYSYLSFYDSSKYFVMSNSVPTGLYFWKQANNGSSTTYYTTG